MSRWCSVAVGVRYSVIAAAATATTGMIDGSTERGGRERGREMEDRGSAATATALRLSSSHHSGPSI